VSCVTNVRLSMYRAPPPRTQRARDDYTARKKEYAFERERRQQQLEDEFVAKQVCLCVCTAVCVICAYTQAIALNEHQGQLLAYHQYRQAKLQSQHLVHMQQLLERHQVCLSELRLCLRVMCDVCRVRAQAQRVALEIKYIDEQEAVMASALQVTCRCHRCLCNTTQSRTCQRAQSRIPRPQQELRTLFETEHSARRSAMILQQVRMGGEAHCAVIARTRLVRSHSLTRAVATAVGRQKLAAQGPAGEVGAGESAVVRVHAVCTLCMCVCWVRLLLMYVHAQLNSNIESMMRLAPAGDFDATTATPTTLSPTSKYSERVVQLLRRREQLLSMHDEQVQRLEVSATVLCACA
jgi:hypothetical protein